MFFEQLVAIFSHNDSDFDCLVTSSSTLLLLENDGTGNFTDITAEAVWSDGLFPPGEARGFDNDGYVDLVYSGGAQYFRNNGMTFLPTSPTCFLTETPCTALPRAMSTATAGWMYASYGNGYVTPDNGNDDVLWLNQGNDQHWIV